MSGNDATLPSDDSSGPGPDFGMPGIEALQELFPHLEVIELLGAGGMGAVYKARQPKLDRYVAVKILSKRLAGDPEFVARFQREAKAMAKLDHPNIVTIYDFGDRGGFYYFIMEFVDGGDLHQLVTAGKLEPAAVLDLVPQICEAIQFAHEEGVTHRDIKPANILLDTKGRVKIADFGLAKMLAGNSDVSLTMTGTAMGTPFYMAPEQLINSDKVDQRADIYSLGVVLYQLLTGVLPQGDFAPPSKTLPGLSSSVDSAVMRALAQDPEMRFSEVREMLEALHLMGEERQKQKSNTPTGNPLAWSGVILISAILVWGVVYWKPWEKLEIKPAADVKVPDGIVTVAGTKAGEERFFEIASDVKIPFHWCPPGEFWMGSPVFEPGRYSDETRHRVRLTEGFWLGKTEFTQWDWESVTGRKPKKFSEVGPEAPLVDASWDQIASAGGFLDMIQSNAPDGWRFDLPTEAQWEYASRAGTETPHFFGSHDGDAPVIHHYGNGGDYRGYPGFSNLNDGFGDQVAPVGSFKPNPWGFYDMPGNVSEFCLDWYGDYPNDVVTNPVGPAIGTEKVHRGGNFKNGPQDLRSARRASVAPGFAGHWLIGFRLALVPNRSTEEQPPGIPEQESFSTLKPLIPEMRPGRLRGISNSLDGSSKAIDLPAFEEIDDLVQIRTTIIPDEVQIVGLRSNGQLVAHNIPETWKKYIERLNNGTPIRYLGYNFQSMHHLVVIDEEGNALPLLPGHVMNRNFPKPEVPVVDARSAEGHGLLLTESGEAMLWGDDFSDEEEGWPKPPRDFLTNVAEIRVNRDALFLRKKDGEVVAWGPGGEINLPETVSRNIQSIAIHDGQLASLTAEGELLKTAPMNQYAELYAENPVATKAAKLKDFGSRLKSYQSVDGEWKFVDEAKLKEHRWDAVAHIFDAVASLDQHPPDSFALLGNLESENRLIFWIDPENAPRNPVVDPLVPEIKPGKLLGIYDSLDGSQRPMDLSAFDDFDDIVQVRTASNPSDLQIIALRSNGRIVAANLHEGWQKWVDVINSGTPLRHLGYSHYSMHHLVAIDRDGKPVPLIPSHSSHGTFPRPGEPLADVRTAEGHGMMLTETGKAIPWGRDFEKTNDPWPMPPQPFLTDVVDIVVGTEAMFLLKTSGEVKGWGSDGEIILPEPLHQGIKKIGLNDVQLAALDAEGNLWATGYRNGFDSLHNGDGLFTAGIDELKDQGINFIVIRKENGPWVLTEYWKNFAGAQNIAKKLAELGTYPADAFVNGGGSKEQDRFLIWIEPNPMVNAERGGPLSIDLPPALAAMKRRGGRLQSWMTRGFWHKPDLTPANGVTDFIELDGRTNKWLARRANET